MLNAININNVIKIFILNFNINFKITKKLWIIYRKHENLAFQKAMDDFQKAVDDFQKAMDDFKKQSKKLIVVKWSPTYKKS